MAWRLALTLGVFIAGPPVMILLIDLAGDPSAVPPARASEYGRRVSWLALLARALFLGVIILLGVFMWWPYIQRAIRAQLQRDGYQVCRSCGFVVSPRRVAQNTDWTCPECGIENHTESQQ